MGCGTSTTAGMLTSNFNQSFFIKINKSWDLVEKSCKQKSHKKCVISRTGWKTIRIFVSSTFKDFHAERETLVKQVFPDLRNWCEEKLLHLIECDLR